MAMGFDHCVALKWECLAGKTKVTAKQWHDADKLSMCTLFWGCRQLEAALETSRLL